DVSHPATHPPGRPPPIGRYPPLGVHMTVKYRVGNACCDLGPERAGRGRVTKQRRLRETPHLHRPFHHLPGAAEREAAVCRTPNNRYAVEIDIRSKPSVDVDLAPACRMTIFQGREIEVGQADRPLRFPAMIADQKNVIAWGIDPVA